MTNMVERSPPKHWTTGLHTIAPHHDAVSADEWKEMNELAIKAYRAWQAATDEALK